MRPLSETDVRRTLDAVLDQICADHEPVMILRRGDKPAAVLMSLEEFAAWDETAYLLASPANAEHLLASIAELDR